MEDGKGKRLRGGREGKEMEWEMHTTVPSKVRSHEAGKAIESQAGVILVMAGDVLANHVGGEHNHIQTFVEGLRRTHVPNTLHGRL